MSTYSPDFPPVWAEWPYWVQRLDLVETIQRREEDLAARERQVRRELERQRNYKRKVASELLWEVDDRQRLKRSEKTRIEKMQTANHAQDEIARSLRLKVKALREKGASIAAMDEELVDTNRRLRHLVSDLEAAAPKVTISRCAEPTRCAWRVDDVQELLRVHPRASCVFSPSMHNPKLVTRPVELDFYPNGAASAPKGHCSLSVRLPRGSEATLQLFVGSARTDAINLTFTERTRECIQHFAGLRHELCKSRSKGDDSIVVGVDVLRARMTTKYLL